MPTYSDSLESVKNDYPFSRWQRSGLEQYTPQACAAFQAIFDKLLSKLTTLGSAAPETEKIALFKEAIEATNALNEEDESLIETGEREDLCALTNQIATAAGIDPAKYGSGEGPASEWRDW
jgi:hypothetical protein